MELAGEMKPKLKILVTGIGAPGTSGTIYALKNNPDAVEIATIGTDMRVDAPGRPLADQFRLVPPPEDDGYVETMIDICVTEGVDVVVPQTTRECAVLSHERSRMIEAGVAVLVASAESFRSANNKAVLLDCFSGLGFPTPDYRRAGDEDQLRSAAHELGYPEVPVVVKPTDLFGMRGFRVLIENKWDQDRFLGEKPDGAETGLDDLILVLSTGEQYPDLLVTEFLPGDEYSIDAFVGSRCEIAVSRLRKSIRTGISVESVVELREDMSGPTLAAAKALGLTLTFGMQFKLVSRL